jgi:hypothetical protein
MISLLVNLQNLRVAPNKLRMVYYWCCGCKACNASHSTPDEGPKRCTARLISLLMNLQCMILQAKYTSTYHPVPMPHASTAAHWLHRTGSTKGHKEHQLTHGSLCRGLQSHCPAPSKGTS